MAMTIVSVVIQALQLDSSFEKKDSGKEQGRECLLRIQEAQQSSRTNGGSLAAREHVSCCQNINNEDKALNSLNETHDVEGGVQRVLEPAGIQPKALSLR